ncbi:hypothetical protein ACJX0J_018403, partial [Zea mays]
YINFITKNKPSNHGVDLPHGYPDLVCYIFFSDLIVGYGGRYVRMIIVVLHNIHTRLTLYDVIYPDEWEELATMGSSRIGSSSRASSSLHASLHLASGNTLYAIKHPCLSSF